MEKQTEQVSREINQSHNELQLVQYSQFPLHTNEEMEQKSQCNLSALISKLYVTLVIDSCWVFNNKVANMLLLFVIYSVTCWLLIFIMSDSNSLPGGLYFSLMVFLISGHIFGYFFEKIKLPSLLGN